MSSKFLLATLLSLSATLPASAQVKGNAAEGAKIFRTVNCAMCHSLNGDNLMEPKKPLKGPGFLKKYPDDESIAKRIREGSPNGIMPAFYKDQVSDKQLVDLIAFIRSLTPATSKSPQSTAGSHPVRAAVGASHPAPIPVRAAAGGSSQPAPVPVHAASSINAGGAKAVSTSKATKDAPKPKSSTSNTPPAKVSK